VVKPMDDIFQLMQDWAFEPDAMQARDAGIRDGVPAK